ncbi:MAG: EamA family transporter [Gallionella sp.]
MSYFYIFLTIVLTVYGQVVIKWQVIKAGALPEQLPEKISFMLHLLLNPWIVSALFAAFLASFCWMAAMTKLQLSHAYPFMGMTFVLVLLAGGFIFQEPITSFKVVGVSLIVLGLVVASQG